MRSGLILFFILFVGCKTQEDVRREQTVQNLNEEIQQTKKTTANGNSRFLAIEEQVSRLNGQLEEAHHNRTQAILENKQLQERITSLEENHKKQVEYLKALTEKVNNQSGYIEEVIASLAKLAEKPAEKNSSKKKIKKSEDEALEVATPITFKNAYEKFQNNDLATAKDYFQQIVENKKTKRKNKEGPMFYLGMIDFKNKNYEGAKTYFTKIFSDSPTSSFAPPALLQLGKIFSLQKSNEEADMTYNELITRFPKSKEAQEAKKIQKLKNE